MRIAITGASGNLGRSLVPALRATGATLLLIGRSPEALKIAYPGCEAVDYDGIVEAAQGYDLLLHLAALNNDQDAPEPEFARVNVDLAVTTCRYAREAGIKRFLYASSTHALDARNNSPYAKSKRAAVEALTIETGIAILPVYLPAVIGDQLSGKLSALNSLWRPLRHAALAALGALRPTVHMDAIAAVVLELAQGEMPATSPLIVSDGQAKNRLFRFTKRLVDLAFAIGVLVVLWWAMIIIWTIVRLQSPGPGIFRQQRVGRNERVFTCYKFRTMYVSTPNLGTHEVSAAAVTPFGNFMRRTKLDELPQVFNILLNQMSLVGPRPCLPTQLALIEERRARQVFSIKPGITGLGQVNGVDMSDPVRLANWDRQYLDLRSVLLDLRIMLATARGGGGGDNLKTN